MSGGGGHQGGGGGSGGTASWPSYLQSSHERFLNEGVTADIEGDVVNDMNMENAVAEAWDSSPYETAIAYDPSEAIAETQTRYDSFNSSITDFVPLEDYEEAWDKAVALADAELSDTKVQAAVDAFEARQTPALMRAISRFSAGMADIGAYNSSAFLLGQALIENEHQAGIAKFHADLAMNNYGQRIQAILPMAESILRATIQKIEFDRAAAALQGELNRVRIVALREFYDDELENAIKDATWNFELLNYAGTLIGAISGGGGGVSPSQRKATTGVSMLGGAIAGGASGAMIGSMTPIPGGTFIGAGIGALLGGMGS